MNADADHLSDSGSNGTPGNVATRDSVIIRQHFVRIRSQCHFETMVQSGAGLCRSMGLRNTSLTEMERLVVECPVANMASRTSAQHMSD